MENITVIGIDPAPSKDSTIFNGEDFDQKDYKKLQEYLNDLKKSKSKILICWDAPLSFSIGNYMDEKVSLFYQRKIEYFFSRSEGAITPAGISVRGYAGCPHWAISQYLIGYPKINSFCKNFEPDFNLVFSNENIRKSVTEVHPAVAIWMWCKKGKNAAWTWNYKKDKKVFRKIVKELSSKGIIVHDFEEKITTDDQLDSYIAWVLGKRWMEKKGEVQILGDNNTGSFLLPYIERYWQKFSTFKV